MRGGRAYRRRAAGPALNRPDFLYLLTSYRHLVIAYEFTAYPQGADRDADARLATGGRAGRDDGEGAGRRRVRVLRRHAHADAVHGAADPGGGQDRGDPAAGTDRPRRLSP